jgi:predicted negative regulator of RcsB-dependent stress response
MFQGDLKAPKGDFAAALASYDAAAASAPEVLRPFATAEKVMTLEVAGKYAECAASAQQFLDANFDHVLAAKVHTVLARCQMAQGQADAAKATLQRIALQYPNTPWADWATNRLQPPTK